MPYGIFHTGPDSKPYCVHKKDEDGEPIGKPLGCHGSKAEAEKQLAALYANEEKAVVHAAWSEVKTGKAPRALQVLGVPFGGPIAGKDSDGEYFSPRTNLMLKPGDKRPVLYNHGADPDNDREKRPEVIGEATYTHQDDKGHWFDVVVDDVKDYAKRIVEAARNGLARASSGAINYLVRRSADGEITTWPLGELTLIDKQPGFREPANDYAVAYLKTAFEQSGLELPEAFAEAGEAGATAAKDECGCKERMSINPELLAEARRITRRR
jgi:hypothetical protein